MIHSFLRFTFRHKGPPLVATFVCKSELTLLSTARLAKGLFSVDDCVDDLPTARLLPKSTLTLQTSEYPSQFQAQSS